jgi:hypothetical protein
MEVPARRVRGSANVSFGRTFSCEQKSELPAASPGTYQG